MGAWWAGLTALNQWLYLAAGFFSLFFIWQLIGAVLGVAGGEDMSAGHGDVGGHDVPAHADAADAHGHHVADVSFKLLSFRSIIAFCTLFAWAGALYLQRGLTPTLSLVYAFGWGLAAMVIMALLFWLMGRMVESGNARLASCVGGSGTVYLDIPAGGTGEARVVVGGSLIHVPARSADGSPVKAGTPVTVTAALGPNLLQVQGDAQSALSKKEG